ncbi:MAG: T9SS type A sorting domain-containing protein [Candidatus Marinimicrobia bacterium]|nr:T9SS type A sorting domain-containing protein [Candidatus Neomarinimicrobiota bacterium]
MGKMNKPAKIIATMMVAVSALFGQINNFEFVLDETDYVGSQDTVVMYGHVTSLSVENHSISMTKTSLTDPAPWPYAFCVGPACLPSFVYVHTFSLEAGSTADFSLDVYPNGVSGSNTFIMFAVDSLTMEVDSVIINLEILTVAIDDEISAPADFSLSPLYPNPTNAWINFDLSVETTGRFNFTLYSLDGREVASREYQLNSGSNHIAWGLSNFASGNYIMTATGASSRISRQVSIVK